MKRILMPALIASVMFGLSAVGSWKWRQGRLAQTSSSAVDGDSAESSAEDSGNHHPPAANEKNHPAGSADHSPAASDHKGGPAVAPPERKPARPETVQLPLSVRPAYAVGVEEAAQLAAGLRDRTIVVREREMQMAVRKKQLELVQEDIRSERAAMDDLRKQVTEEMKAAEERLAAAERAHAEVEHERQTMNGRVTQMEVQEKDNIKKMGSMYDSMAPESAAKILQQMTDTGKMDTAVKLLGVMKERQAAKVLAEMSDPSLAAQLSEKLKGLKRPASQPKK